MGSILIVEDNPVQAKLVEAYLRDTEPTKVAPDGEAALKELSANPYEIVLLDINLPGIDGYEVCRQIKEDPRLSDTSVIFLSANGEEEDRLKGFEVGGHDFLAKPVARAELLAKIAALMSFKTEQVNLKQTVSYASTTAMSAMSSAAEQGMVLQFLLKSFACATSLALAESVVCTCNSFGLQCLVQLRGQSGVLNYGSNGPCTPIEASILTNLSSSGQIVEISKRTSIRYDRCTLILLNMPREETERYERLKDHLVTLVEGVDSLMVSMDIKTALVRASEQQLDIVNSIGAQLLQINQRSMNLHTFSTDILRTMAMRLHETIPMLDLNSNQEAMLVNLMRDAEEGLDSVLDQGLVVERAMVTALETLQDMNQSTRAAFSAIMGNGK